MTSETVKLPLLPLRDIVVFPFMVIPLFVGREKSVLALEKSMAEQKNIFLAAQRNPNNNDPEPTDIYETGTLANILQILKLTDGTMKILVEGVGFRELTEEGIIQFRTFLKKLRQDHTLTPEWGLLKSRETSVVVNGLTGIERPGFKNKRDAATYLSEVLRPLAGQGLFKNVGLWSWLSLYYFDDVCP